jgi:LmbE family N-acetylglucosaminyl deacetylase
MTASSPEYPQLDVIAVGAHPDDVEIACGGSLAMLTRLGYQVGIIDLTDGEPTPGCDDPKIRAAEAAAAAKVLGVPVRVTLDLPNRKLFDTYEARVALATEFRRYRPRVVIGFGEKTPTASPDHWQAMQITEAAIFYSRLSKWDDEFAGTAPHKIPAQLYFRLSWEPVLANSGVSYFVMDISGTLDAKMASIRCYQTQFPPAKQHVLVRTEAAARQVGSSAGFAAGELFVTPRTLGTSDLLSLVLP